MQLSLNIDPPKPDSRAILIDIMRRKGPCRCIAIVCEPDLPPDAYETFNDLVREGVLQVVGEVRYRGVVPAEHVDKLYAVKEGLCS